MFTVPSLTKILVLLGVLAIVWYGFRMVGRMDRDRQAAAKRPAAAPKPRRRWRREREPKAVEDLTECGSCHAFVPVAKACSQCGARL
mgnify:CR=1 FL=1